MATKKDYKVIAGVLSEFQQVFPYCVSLMAERFARIFIATNPKFDKKKFLSACHLDNDPFKE